MARPPRELEIEQVLQLQAAIDRLQLYTAINGLETANAALVKLAADLCTNRHNREGLLDDLGRYELWKTAGTSIARCAGPGLGDALLAAGSTLDLRRASDFLNGSRYGTPDAE